MWRSIGCHKPNAEVRQTLSEDTVWQDAIDGITLGCETRLLMALLSSLLLADPIEENSFQDIAWHREVGKPSVFVTLLGVTLSLPDRKDNAPSPVGGDDPRIPNGT